MGVKIKGMTLVPQIAIIADDLTGAADSGAGFAHAGWLTLVVTRPTAAEDEPTPAIELPEGDVLVISTESRHLARDQAVARTRLAASQFRGKRGAGELTWVYKKIDSTLRGHPGPELAAVMDSLGLERALVAPAFPAQGRTTLGGRQLVGGVPLEHTAFGREVHCSDLLALFREGKEGRPARLVELSAVRRGTAAVCEVLTLPGPAVVVADAETEADLVTLAQAALTCGVRLLCGSAGLARALVDVLLTQAITTIGTGPTLRARMPQLPPRLSGPVLAVVGSQHARTACQIQVAQGEGVLVLRPDPALLGSDGEAVQRTVEAAADHLACGRNAILTTIGLSDSTLGSQAMAGRLAEVARGLVGQGQVGALILSGGDIAAAVCAALEASALWLRGETQPGIAWGVLLDGLAPGLPVLTKAGGFGADAALALAMQGNWYG